MPLFDVVVKVTLRLPGDNAVAAGLVAADAVRAAWEGEDCELPGADHAECLGIKASSEDITPAPAAGHG